MEFKLNIEKPIDIGQLDQEFRAIFGEGFVGLNGDTSVLSFIFSEDVKVTEDAVVALLLEHTPRPNTDEADRKDALMVLASYQPPQVSQDNVLEVVQELTNIVLAFRKIYFG